MLEDLRDALRKRRLFAFLGFALANTEGVPTATRPFFCPSSFVGFLRKVPETRRTEDTVFLSGLEVGFAANWPMVEAPDGPIFLADDFGGFANDAAQVSPVAGPTFLPARFKGFLKTAPNCTQSFSPILGATMYEID